MVRHSMYDDKNFIAVKQQARSIDRETRIVPCLEGESFARTFIMSQEFSFMRFDEQGEWQVGLEV